MVSHNLNWHKQLSDIMITAYVTTGVAKAEMGSGEVASAARPLTNGVMSGAGSVPSD